MKKRCFFFFLLKYFFVCKSSSANISIFNVQNFVRLFPSLNIFGVCPKCWVCYTYHRHGYDICNILYHKYGQLVRCSYVSVFYNFHYFQNNGKHVLFCVAKLQKENWWTFTYIVAKDLKIREPNLILQTQVCRLTGISLYFLN